MFGPARVAVRRVPSWADDEWVEAEVGAVGRLGSAASPWRRCWHEGRVRESGGAALDESSCIALTGLDTFLGVRLAERLAALPDGPRVIGLDDRQPTRLASGIDFERIDLMRPEAGEALAEILVRNGVTALAHLAFRESPTPDLDSDHDLEVVGSLQVMNAFAAAKVGRLVVPSSTMLYGPHPHNPNYLSEQHELAGHRPAHSVENRVEVERMLASWRGRHPEVELTVLRHCWVMGPSYDDAVVRFFDRPSVTTLLGHDPLLQFVHEDDLVNAALRAVCESHPGTFNIVGRGVLPLSNLLALAGKRRIALPSPLLYRVLDSACRAETGDSPAGFYDYLRYLWIADGERGWAEFGEPAYSTREAWVSFVSSRRLRRYS